MVDVRNAPLYELALRQLKAHKKEVGRSFKGRLVLFFLGMKFHQNSLPSMFSGSFISSEVLQSLLDDLYAKSSRPPQSSVLIAFEGNYLPRTGIRRPGYKDASNTWRNHFHLQKGVGCYAPKGDLASQTFLDQPRVECRYLKPKAKGTLNGARCSLCTTGQYRHESHRKWLQIDPSQNGFAVVDLQNIANFLPYIAPAGLRIPFWPFAVAVYHDADPGLVIGTRSVITPAEFISDFNLSVQEFEAYFDADASNAQNAAMLKGSAIKGGAVAPRSLLKATSKGTRAVPNQPVLFATQVAPPQVNTGWDAEYYVAAALERAGWSAHVVSRQSLGYDVFAQKGRVKRYVEVKSSLGSCTPTLTSREWQQAAVHAGNYVLAVVENFSPSASNTVYWIPDPANRCVATTQHSVSHALARGVWTTATVPLDQL